VDKNENLCYTAGTATGSGAGNGIRRTGEHSVKDDLQVTISDVARHAGVSVSTVSRILNNKPDVSVATRAHVTKVIKDLGFTPHVQATSLAAGRSRTIALLFPLEQTGDTQLPLDFITGAAHAAEEKGFFCTLVTAPMSETSLPALYRSGQADGVILVQVYLDDWRVNTLRRLNYPFVMNGRCADNTGISFIDLDFERAVIIAFEHLVELGHRTIGFLGFPAAQRASGYGPAVRSFAGYQKFCETHGLMPLYREVERTPQAMAEATRSLLEERPDLTGIMTTNGPSVIGALRVLEAHSHRVPDDVSVIAVVPDRIAELITPPLTSISFSTSKMGYDAACMLIKRLEKTGVEEEQRLLTPQIHIRASIGPVARCGKEVP
jgi:DNA-binding LacI/PurR family transcriptional regulator